MSVACVVSGASQLGHEVVLSLTRLGDPVVGNVTCSIPACVNNAAVSLNRGYV